MECVPDQVAEFRKRGLVRGIERVVHVGLNEHADLVALAAEHDSAAHGLVRHDRALGRDGNDLLAVCQHQHVIYPSNTAERISCCHERSSRVRAHIFQRPGTVGCGTQRSFVA
jgi:hypothetical protein